MPRRSAKKQATASAKPSPPPPVSATTPSPDESPAAVSETKAVQEPKKVTDHTAAMPEGEVVVNMEDAVPEVEHEGEGPTADNIEVDGSEEDPEEGDEEDPEGDDEPQEDEEDVNKEDAAEELGEQKREIKAAVRGRSGDGDVSVDCDDMENNEDAGGRQDADNGNEVNEENASVLRLDNSLTERQNQMELEIHVGGLHKRTVDKDLMGVFGVFGEIDLVRVIKYPNSQKSRGYAFVRYKTVESVKKVMEEFKDGTEINGKRIKISACKDNVILRVINICNTWTRNDVVEGLKRLGVDKVADVDLPDDPEKEGQNNGYCFLEFYTHSDALSAFQRLGKEDAVLGSDKSARAFFARKPPSGEAMLQARAAPAKAQTKKNLAAQGRDDGKDLKNDTSSKGKNINLSGKGKTADRKIEGKVKNAKKNEASNVQSKQIEGKAGVRQAEKGVPAKGKKRHHERETMSVVNQRKTKKANNNRYYGRGPSNFSIAGGHNYMVPAINASGFFQPARSYNHPAYIGTSRSIAHRADLEPHAGFLPPVEQSLDPSRYDRRRIQERIPSSYGVSPVPGPLYHGFSGHTGYEVGYGYPIGGPHALHRAYY